MIGYIPNLVVWNRTPLRSKLSHIADERSKLPLLSWQISESVRLLCTLSWTPDEANTGEYGYSFSCHVTLSALYEEFVLSSLAFDPGRESWICIVFAWKTCVSMSGFKLNNF